MPDFVAGAVLTAAQLNQLQKLFRGAISGLVPSNDDAADGDDINFTAGVARDSSNTYNIIAGTERTKQADATWAAGDDAGGMASGVSWSASTTYHMFLLGDASDETAYDFGFDTSLTATNLLADAAVVAAGYDIYRRVWSMRSSATPGWPGFSAVEIAGGGIRTEYKAMVADLSAYSAATTRQTLALTVPADVAVLAHLATMLTENSVGTGAAHAWIRTVNFTDATPAIGLQDLSLIEDNAAVVGRVVASLDVVTNTARTIAHRQSKTAVDLQILTSGFTDLRR